MDGGGRAGGERGMGGGAGAAAEGRACDHRAIRAGRRAGGQRPQGRAAGGLPGVDAGCVRFLPGGLLPDRHRARVS